MDKADSLTDEQKLSLWEKTKSDPVWYAFEVLGIEELEGYQEKLIRCVAENERTVIKSCHNMGKTFCGSIIVLWFVPNHPRSKTVSTAPTGRQVRLLLWGEIGAGYARARYPLGGQLTTTSWKIAPDWFAEGFTTQKEAASGQGQSNSGFQGIHAHGGVLVLFDEATGIAPDIWKQLEGLMTQANVRFVAFGNPTTKSCQFYKCFSDPTYKKIHLSCFDSPNLQANGIVDMTTLIAEYDALRELDDEGKLKRLDSYKLVKPHLLTTKWVMGRALNWGLDHPLFISKVLGDFPDEDERCLMPLGAVEMAQKRTPLEGGAGRFYIGADVARYGGDKSVLTRFKDTAQKEVKVLVKRATTEVSGAVIAMVNALPDEERNAGGVITVDATGIGSGVVDELHEYKRENSLTWRNVVIQEFHSGERFKSPRDGSEKECKEREEKYANKKAEAFVLLAEDVKTELTLLPEEVYQEELPTIIYQFDSKGRWVIEDKDAYKKRTGRGSPDHADSASLANYGRHYSGVSAGELTESMAQSGRGVRAGSARGRGRW